MPDVAALEDICERAWPPVERIEREGVVLRFADGFTRRANSARCDGPAADLERLVALVEDEYRRRGSTGFRITPLTPGGVEPLLRKRGYFADAEAVVMVADGLPAGTLGDEDVALSPALDEQWLRVFHAIERPLAARAGSRRALHPRVGVGAASLRARSRRRRPGGHRLRPPRGRLALPRMRGRDPPQRRRGLARAVSERVLCVGRRPRRASRRAPGADFERRSSGPLRPASASARAMSIVISSGGRGCSSVSASGRVRRSCSRRTRRARSGTATSARSTCCSACCVEAEGAAARALTSLGVTIETARVQVVVIAGRGDDVRTTGQIPFTARAERALEFSLREALALGHGFIDTDDVLLGVVRDEEARRCEC